MPAVTTDSAAVIGRVRVPATTANLGPGFDAVGAAIGLHLVVTAVRPTATGVGDGRVSPRGEGAGQVPVGEDNLVWQAFATLCGQAGAEIPDVRVLADNRIPLARGLGSSAAAIVAGLGLARAVLDLEIGDRELVRLATDLEGHPDNVAAAVLGGLVNVTTEDDTGPVLRRAQPHARLRPVVFVISEQQSTTAARAVLADAVSRDDVTVQAARAGHVLAGVAGLWPVAPGVAGDKLHEPPRLATMPASAELIADLRDAGVHAWLSGAGPSVAAAVAVADDQLWSACRTIGRRVGADVRSLTWDLSGLTVVAPRGA